MSATAVTWGIAERSLRLIPRVPSTFIPSLVMPVFFTLAFSGPFAALVNLPGFPAQDILDWVVPFTALQGAAFAGMTIGMGVARDIESGFYDRILMSPAPRSSLLAGTFVAAMLRSLIALGLMIVVGLVAGANFREGLVGVLVLVVAGLGLAVAASAWAAGLAFRFKTLQAAPLMQMGVFLSIFLSTAQMPLELLTGWLRDVAEVNPITEVLAMSRQGFLGDVTWNATSDGLIALAAMIAVLGFFAYRGLKKVIP